MIGKVARGMSCPPCDLLSPGCLFSKPEAACHLCGTSEIRWVLVCTPRAQDLNRPLPQKENHEALHRPPRPQPSPGVDVFD